MKSIKTNKSKGFTLIETIIAVGIISLLIGNVLLSSEKTLEYINKVEVESCKNNILSFINNSKLYCRNKGTKGFVQFVPSNKQIKLKVGGRIIDTLTIPKAFILKDVITHDSMNSMEIDKFGFTSDACTINFNDKYGKEHKLSVCVGTGYCDVKEDN